MGSHSESCHFPLAYLITVRSFGTWLHGDERCSVDRHGFNVYGTPRRTPNTKLTDIMNTNNRQGPIVFTGEQSHVIEQAIKEVCHFRGYHL
jgi:hypothetical protein